MMIVVERALYDDCADLVALEDSSFEVERLSKLRFLYHINNPNSLIVIAKIEGVAVGYGMVFWHRNRTNARLYSLCTFPEFRGMGVGTAILNYIEEIAATKHVGISLEVREDNSSAQRLYKSLGYQIVRIKKKYYIDGTSALVMQKKFLL